MRHEEAEVLARVSDEASFIAFLRHLADEREALEAMAREGKAVPGFLSGLGDWEYDTIGGFLDAAAARGESGAGYDFDEVSRADNPWRRAARILLMGKYYE